LAAALDGEVTNIGDKLGRNKTTLTQLNMPNYNLAVTPNPHSHVIANSLDDANGGGKAAVGNNATEGSLSTEPVTLTVNSAGSSMPFDNRQPTFYCYKIMRLN
jgi:microcystin-dependent protein